MSLARHEHILADAKEAAVPDKPERICCVCLAPADVHPTDDEDWYCGSCWDAVCDREAGSNRNDGRKA